MTEDTLLRARLRATVREKGLRYLSSARASLLRSVAGDAGHLRQPNARDWPARLLEEDTKSSLHLVPAARRVVVSLPAESVHPWLVV